MVDGMKDGLGLSACSLALITTSHDSHMTVTCHVTVTCDTHFVECVSSTNYVFVRCCSGGGLGSARGTESLRILRKNCCKPTEYATSCISTRRTCSHLTILFLFWVLQPDWCLWLAKLLPRKIHIVNGPLLRPFQNGYWKWAGYETTDTWE